MEYEAKMYKELDIPLGPNYPSFTSQSISDEFPNGDPTKYGEYQTNLISALNNNSPELLSIYTSLEDGFIQFYHQMPDANKNHFVKTKRLPPLLLKLLKK